VHNIPLIILALLAPLLAVLVRVGLGLQYAINVAIALACIYLDAAHAIPNLGLLTIAHAIWVVCTAD
jgi:uncharacterized membrane protein YqaE (UPF0057 family)